MSFREQQFQWELPTQRVYMTLWESGLIYECVHQYGCTVALNKHCGKDGRSKEQRWVQHEVPCLAHVEESCSLGYHVCDLKTHHS